MVDADWSRREMRKAGKRKQRSCRLCKPNTMGLDVRRKPRELVALPAAERAMRELLHRLGS